MMAACATAGSPGDWKFVRNLGSGAFGTVYLVERGSDLFALKEIDLHRAPDKEKEAAEKEREALKLLAHEHVVGYVDSVMVKDYLCILTEYCQGGDMAVFLQNISKAVPESLLLCWLYQMACALEYMHGGHPVILHRDLKPSNIYLTAKGDIKLGDLGIARILTHPKSLATTFCGTPCYMSPEVIQEKAYDAKTDIWSLGCVLVEMATEEKAFNGTSLITLFRVIVNQEIKPLPPEVYSPGLSELVRNMMKLNPVDRPTASEILDTQLLQETLEKRKTPQDWLTHYKFLDFLDGQGTETCDSRPISLSLLSGTIPDKSFENFYDKRNRSPTGRIHYDATVVDKGHRTLKHSKKNLDAVYRYSGSSSSSSCSPPLPRPP
ncbi:serine/threonine-protein kinase Nek6-like [Pomacea canaliculata]|uniref:serine/threonine-protein kinase Nek6-like n=1 Tax=Pomacea canaliculata TaxID=400727 RepID=UPI000D738D8A|nr:serine/threonine-protein kinase Nek6-like [Pomacea canaliculata]XP_025107922.1 serine/threonine-protein kinase Nek6-like [Pomacea canaliculata]